MHARAITTNLQPVLRRQQSRQLSAIAESCHLTSLRQVQLLVDRCQTRRYRLTRLQGLTRHRCPLVALVLALSLQESLQSQPSHCPRRTPLRTFCPRSTRFVRRAPATTSFSYLKRHRRARTWPSSSTPTATTSQQPMLHQLMT